MNLSKHNKIEIIKNLGFSELNEMQNATIDAATQHPHLLLLAPTGSGKTVAYLLSILSRIQKKPGVQALILVPTRELVLQVESVLKQMKTGWKINVAYGGHPFSVERQNFTHPPEILIGTPGRVQDHMQRETFDVSTIEQVVFDEFDKSLELGFSKQMEFIRAELKHVKRQLLVSATQRIEIPGYLQLKDLHTLDFSQEEKIDLELKQLLVSKEEKPEGLIKIINNLEDGENALVFVNHRDACDRIAEYFNIFKISYSIFHGGLEQDQRELELTKFRNGSSRVLIATDIASRGIDIPELDYVIHYQIPPQETVFTHRNGRTARMKATGTAVIIRSQLDKLPSYLQEEPENIKLKEGRELSQSEWVTLYVGKGKKDKVNKIDIVGFFLQFHFMAKDDIGLIEMKDYAAYIAVKRDKYQDLLKVSKDKKMKNKKPKIALAR
ncbi:MULTISPECIES: DEAD/DEAH box helicase [unclassified Lentimicrobium]|uniref:DEAD/DEAH box helicase n=1 Tax=unclassified Lentimicrobium TaxID=2677434 RepID=UPI0015581BE6|nr:MULTISPECIES: DEAD/DEAH box helicase [unclassified Lentimicrobium]NPD44999.1 DEAD/DEAH box helicase [Lentimicrobium sp. S6]NPD83505.1 DEAD/DEAH box helicase [Lentimicrobium sp. L6]